jgi:hypothetical protein
VDKILKIIKSSMRKSLKLIDFLGCDNLEIIPTGIYLEGQKLVWKKIAGIQSV